MTVYDDKDISVSSGRPAELFQFTGAAQAFYTTAQQPVFYYGNTYEPDFIMHAALEHSPELDKQTLEIEMRGNAPVLQQFIEDIPTVSTGVKVFRYIIGVDEFRLVWAGRITKPVFNFETGICTVNCEPIFTVLKRAGLRRNYQITCPYAVYDARCKANIASFTVQDVLSSVSNAVLSGPNIAAKANNWFTGGVLAHNGIRKLIVNHTAGKIYLSSGIKGQAAGDTVHVTAGCDKLLTTCADKFNNYLNFGGFWWIPNKNPFSGSSLHST